MGGGEFLEIPYSGLQQKRKNKKSILGGANFEVGWLLAHAAPPKRVLDIQKWSDNSQYSPLDPDYGARHPDMAPGHPVKGTKAP